LEESVLKGRSGDDQENRYQTRSAPLMQIIARHIPR
jgi:hypothetical protein